MVKHRRLKYKDLVREKLQDVLSCDCDKCSGCSAKLSEVISLVEEHMR
ncbi:MAG: hypothetical protein QW429_03935 [Thermoprotei archaeon]